MSLDLNPREDGLRQMIVEFGMCALGWGHTDWHLITSERTKLVQPGQRVSAGLCLRSNDAPIPDNVNG